MNLMHSGFLFVLFVFLEAVSGLAIDISKTGSRAQDLPPDHALTEKSQQESSASESVKIIVPTVPQTTTTDKPSTTTSSSTTTSTATTPTTNPTPAPTPAPKPAPTPAPTPANGPWVVRNDTTKTVCIIAKMTMQLNITYPMKNGSLNHAIWNISKNASVSGNCSESMQSIIFQWGDEHKLQINFSANKTTKNFYVSGINLDVNATVFKDSKVENNRTWHFVNESSEFMTPLDMSYKCNKRQDLNLKGDKDELNAVLSVSDAQLEAYANKTKVAFGAAQNCDTFDTPDIVPIAVGCALAILVLIVLVAYLIGRKRSQNRGYLSM